MIPVTVELPIRMAVVEAEGLRVTDGDAGWRGLEACAEQYRARHGDGGPASVEGVDLARSLFRALGIDPTRRRPSSESLLKRALGGKPMPRISTLVDVGNWCSLDFLLPLGLYDADRIDGPVVLRLGGPGESYDAISNRAINLEGRYLLADDTGAFGSPMTDSLRTAATEATTRTAVLLYAPEGYDADRLRDQAGVMGERIVDVCGGTVTRTDVL
jgi:DNA/RNA-binding domain of Phe-tRNA-synthetase-like protein